MVHLPARRHEVDQGQSEVPCGNPGVLDGSGDWGYEEHGCGGELVIWAVRLLYAAYSQGRKGSEKGK